MGALSPWPVGPIGDGVGPFWDWGARAILGSDLHFGRGLFKPKQQTEELTSAQGSGMMRQPWTGLLAGRRMPRSIPRRKVAHAGPGDRYLGGGLANSKGGSIGRVGPAAGSCRALGMPACWCRPRGGPVRLSCARYRFRPWPWGPLWNKLNSNFHLMRSTHHWIRCL